MTDEFYGPTFEDAEESVVFPMGPYVIVVDDWSFKKTKQADEEGNIRYAITPKLKILAAPDDKYLQRAIQPWWPFQGWNCFVIPRACKQAGLDEIDRYYNVKHPDYAGKDERPCLKGSEEENYAKVAAHYMTGEMTDDNGREFKCPDGGLLGQKLRIEIGKPNTKDPANPKTGNVTPSKT